MLDKLLKTIAKRTYRNYKLILVLAVVFTALAVWSASTLTLDMSYASMLPEDSKVSQRYLEVIDNYGGMDNIIILLETKEGERERKEELAGKIARELAKLESIEYVVHEIDVDWQSFAMLYLDYEELVELEQVLAEQQEALPLVIQSGMAMDMEEVFAKLPEGVRDTEVLEENPFLSADERMLYLTARPAGDSNDLFFTETMLAEIDRVTQPLRTEYADVEITVMGMPVMLLEEYEILLTDISYTNILAFLAILTLLIISFRTWWAPMFMGVSLLMAVAWTFGFTGLTIGSVNFISAAFGVIVLGLGVDYGVHVFTRYTLERNNGKEPEEAHLLAVTRTGRGVITGAFTTAAVFFSLLLSSSKGIRELGLTAGVGVLLALVSMLFVLPSILLFWDKRKNRKKGAGEFAFLRKTGLAIERIPGFFLGLILVITLVALIYVPQTSMNNSYYDMLPEDMESLKNNQKLVDSFGSSMDYTLSTTETLDETKELVERLSELHYIKEVDALTKVLPEDQDRKMVVIEDIRKGLEETESFLVGFLEYDPTNEELLLMLEEISNAKDLLPVAKMGLSDLPESMQSHYYQDGQYFIYSYPEGDIWASDAWLDFSRAISEVDPNATGGTIVYQAFIEYSQKDLMVSAPLAAGLVVLILLLNFKRIGLVVLSALPLVLGIVWLLGYSALVGSQWNVVSLVAIPLVLGIGIDAGVHLVQRLADRKESIADSLATVGKGVTVSGLTSMLALGSLATASHKGTASMGLALFWGVGAVLLAALIALPAITVLLRRRSSQLGDR